MSESKSESERERERERKRLSNIERLSIIVISLSLLRAQTSTLISPTAFENFSKKRNMLMRMCTSRTTHHAHTHTHTHTTHHSAPYTHTHTHTHTHHPPPHACTRLMGCVWVQAMWTPMSGRSGAGGKTINCACMKNCKCSRSAAPLLLLSRSLSLARSSTRSLSLILT